MPVSLLPQQFVHKWRQVTLKESGSAKEHFLDLRYPVGHGIPPELEPEGTRFTFEAFSGPPGQEPSATLARSSSARPRVSSSNCATAG